MKMVNYLFIAIGQCGNQLSYELLNMIYDHCVDHQEYLDFHQQHGRSMNRPNSQPSSVRRNVKKSSTIRPFYNPKSQTEVDDSQSLLFDSFFRKDSIGRGKRMSTARIICLDTEPKVIDCCLEKAKTHFSPSNLHSWHYDTGNIAYRHSGAGNNWALGYAMASGEFLEVALNCIRQEIERCDDIPVLIYIHSLAGGTGSGLGTHLVESSYETFSNCFHYHILISPHSFSEVIVQHYNTLLCLSKIYSNTNGILIFDNENAQLLCKQMRLIEKPKLVDLNQIISNHLLTLFIPKRKTTENNNNATVDPFAGSQNVVSLVDDLTFLCSNPYYRFFTIKLTPQTSKDSIDFTYDSWFSLTHTIQRMQLSGCLSERNISNYVKRIGRNYEQSPSASRSMSYRSRSDSKDPHDSHGLDKISELAGEDEENEEESVSLQLLASKRKEGAASETNLIKSVASIITCHGESAHDAALSIVEALSEDSNLSITATTDIFSRSSVIKGATSVRGSTAMKTQSTAGFHQLRPKLFEEYLQSHATYLYGNTAMPIHVYSTNFYLNQYQRSATVLSNDQSFLPLLQRTMSRSADMYQAKAYVHQYLSHGLEEGDFVEAFQTFGSIINYYSDL